MLFILFGLFVSCSALALPRPQNCPTVEQIHASSVIMQVPIHRGLDLLVELLQQQCINPDQVAANLRKLSHAFGLKKTENILAQVLKVYAAHFELHYSPAQVAVLAELFQIAERINIEDNDNYAIHQIRDIASALLKDIKRQSPKLQVQVLERELALLQQMSAILNYIRIPPFRNLHLNNNTAALIRLLIKNKVNPIKAELGLKNYALKTNLRAVSGVAAIGSNVVRQLEIFAVVFSQLKGQQLQNFERAFIRLNQASMLGNLQGAKTMAQEGAKLLSIAQSVKLSRNMLLVLTRHQELYQYVADHFPVQHLSAGVAVKGGQQAEQQNQPLDKQIQQVEYVESRELQ